MELSPLQEEEDGPLSFHHVRKQQEGGRQQARKQLLPDTESVGALILDFSAPELWELIVFFF